MRIWYGVIMLAVGLAGCGKGDDWAPSDTAQVAAKGLPPLPTWAVSLIGTPAARSYKTSTECQGAFDAVKVRYTGEPGGVEAAGWGWLTKTSAAPAQILFTNAAGTIVGAGETSFDRPDVRAALSQVKTSRVGWRGLIRGGTGKVTANAVTPGSGLCALGTRDISPGAG